MAKVKVVLSVLSRQLWWFYLFRGDSYGGAHCHNSTVILVVSVLRRRLCWCYPFRDDNFGGAVCSKATVMVVYLF